MILKDNQRVNIVVRGLIFQEDHLLVTQWRTGDEVAFGIGGRVDFGESLLEALKREVLEETGAIATIHKLLYFGENVFTTDRGIQYHEYGWYFLVEPDRPICGLDEIIQNPDHPDLFIRYLEVSETGLEQFWPRFIAHYLPQDFTQGFNQNPRYIYNADQSNAVDKTETLSFQEFGILFD